MPRFDPKDFHLFAEVNGTLMPVGTLDQPPEFIREGWGMGAIAARRETPAPRVVDAPIPDGIRIPTLADARQLGEYVFIESRAGQRPAESWAFGVALHLGWKLEKMYSGYARFTATRFDLETCTDVEIIVSITMAPHRFDICIDRPIMGGLTYDDGMSKLRQAVFQKAVEARRAGNEEAAERFDKELDSICFDYNYRHIDEIQRIINKMLTKAKLMEK